MMDTETIKRFVIAAHGDLDTVRQMLAEQPDLLGVSHEWREGDFENALQAAAHVGNREIANFLLDAGQPLDICAAAMLGRLEDVRTLLSQDAALANAHGAHSISVMYHAALSGDAGVTAALKDAGCTEGYDHALLAAINKGHTAMVAWLLANGVTDLSVTDFKGRTPLELARALQHAEIAQMLADFAPEA